MAIELIAKIAPKNDGFTGMVDADQVLGGSDLPANVGHTEWDAAYAASHSAVALAASADELLGLSTQELSLDTQAVGKVLSGPLSGGGAAPTFRHLSHIGVAAGLGDILFTKEDGLLLLGPGCLISPTKWETLRGQAITIFGAFHQEQGRWPGTRGLVVEGGTTNIVENPSFEVNVSWWITFNGTSTRIATDSRFGAACDKLTANAANNPYLWKSGVVANPAQDDVYTLSAWVKGVGASIGKNATILIREGGGAQPAASSTGTVALTAQWQRVEVTRTIVENDRTALHIWVRINCNNTEYGYIDGVQLEEKAHATTYCDGSLGTGYSWSGTAHASTSTRTVTEVNLDDHTNLISENNAWSLPLWWKPQYDADADWPDDAVLFDTRGANDNNRVFVKFEDSDDKYHVYINGVDRFQSSVQTFDADEWQFVVLTADFGNDEFGLSINGVADGSDTTNLAAPTLTEMNLGSDYLGANQANAVYAEFPLLDFILTAEEIAALFICNAPMVDAGALTPPVVDGRWLRLPISTDNVSNPPTDAELTIAFGYQPDGFAGLVDDNGAGTAVWKVWRAAGQWWYEGLTAAV